MSKNFRQIYVTILFLGAIIACCVATSHAQDTDWTGGADTNFFNDANWDNTAPNTISEVGIIDSVDVNQVAIIDAGTGTVSLDGINLGEFVGGGNVIQNGGVLLFDGFSTTKIGGDGANPSSWIMNNDALILYDGPFDGGGLGYGLDGQDGSDFDVGNGTSVVNFELHDTAILRIADDLKISDNGADNNATVLLDGNAQITVGSGTSIGDDGLGTLTIAGNARYVSGNSAGPGNTAEGYTNEGYVAMHDANINVKDNGRLWIRTLQHRGGEAHITIENNAQFEIFDVFFNASPELGVSTILGDVNGNERTSELSEDPGNKATITIKNSGVMTVDSNVGGSSWTGLAISGGKNRGGNGGGGETLIDIQDQGTFIVQQDLNMTLGFDVDATSTLKVRGPDAIVQVNGDLRMALDEFDDENPGSASLHAVITAATHSTIEVGGNINIDNGELIVELDGFTPIGGESYQLIDAGSITGTAFSSEDFSLASLLDGLSWEVALDGSSVLLNVIGELTSLPGDFDVDNDTDGSDFLLWQRDPGVGNLSDWQTGYGLSASTVATAAVPEPSTLLLLISVFGLGLSTKKRR